MLFAAALLSATPAIAQEAPAEAAADEVPAPLAAVETVTKIEAGGTVTMTHNIVLAAPAEEVWAAISTPEGWEGWAAPLARWAEGEADILETSYNPDELPGGPGAIWQQFVARIPGRLLVFRTIKVPDDFPNGEAYKRVTSFLELEADGARTRLRLTSTGYPGSEGGRALLGFFAKGNIVALQALQRHLAEPVEPEPAADPPSG
ncbi:SRPBCC domain-containing protein [Sphingopyxis sp.]|uniref:SRPBCC family protein n=1 Tax=Sphingopyxis sp. TaxID=1908224 RepID=UPI0035B3A656